MTLKIRSAPLPNNFMDGTTGEDRNRLRSSLRNGGFGLRQRGGKWEITAKDTSFSGLVELFPLMNEDTGKLRADANHTVCERRPVASVEEAQDALQTLTAMQVPLEVSEHIVRRWQHDLLTQVDPMPIIEAIAGHTQRLWLYRLLPTTALLTRTVTWRMLTAAIEKGTTWAEMRRTESISDAPPMWDPFFVTQFVCIPLLARFQPLGMVFNTLRASQIIAILDSGQFVRTHILPSWPSGGSIASIHGEGRGVYASRYKSFPARHARELLENCVGASNRMFDLLTDPTRWIGNDGKIDIVERNIAWQSLVLGTGTMIEIAEDWTRRESLWSAFQALTVLEGLWGPERLILDSVLDPRTIRQTVRLFPNEVYANWAEDIVSNYESTLLQAFGGSIEDATRSLRLIRNLVHGVGDLPRRRRDKLDALRGIERTEPQLLLDIAAFWWAAVLLLPESHCPPNKPAIQNKRM